MEEIQHVSSIGGPRVLLPTADIPRWIAELGDSPSPDEGLYGLACSVDDYCGIIRPWDCEILVFCDDPGDIYWVPSENGGLFIRWLGADSLDQLLDFGRTIADRAQWSESVKWEVRSTRCSLMDSCTCERDSELRIEIDLCPGSYRIDSKYAETEDVMTIVQRLQRTR